MLFHRPCHLYRIKLLFYGYNLPQFFTLTYCHTLKVSKDAFLFNFKVTIVNSTLESKFVLLTITRLISSIRYYIIMYYQICSCPLIYLHIHCIVSVFCTFNSAYTYITYSRVLLMGLCTVWSGTYWKKVTVVVWWIHRTTLTIPTSNSFGQVFEPWEKNVVLFCRKIIHQ